MPDIQFSPKELSDLRMHYLNEKVRLEDALKHVEAMLQKLGANRQDKPAMTAKGKAPKKARPQEHLGCLHRQAPSGKKQAHDLRGVDRRCHVHPQNP